jgi:hypothetical protein
MGPVGRAYDKSINQLLTLLQKVQQLLAAQGAVDGQQRQRIVVDGGTLPTVTTVGTVTGVTTVTTVTTVTGVTNIAAIAGEGVRQFETPAHNSYANSIRRNLRFE